MTSRKFSAEFRLLIECSKPDAEAVPRFASLGAIDWPEFLELVRRHRLAPAVSRSLSACAVPSAIRDRLARAAYSASARALRHATAMLEVAALFDHHGIPAMAIKGATLSRRLFGDAAMRDVRDIDLLIRPEALEAAGPLLAGARFERRFPRAEPTHRMLDVMLRSEQHFEYYAPQNDVRLELHWQIESWDAAAMAWLWRRSEVRPWPGALVREPDEISHLLLAVDHGARHRWFCLKWLADAAILLTGLDDNAAAELVRAARTFGRSRPLAQAVLLVEELYGARLSALLPREQAAQPLARVAVRALLGSEEEHFGMNRFRQRWYMRRLLPHVRPATWLRARDLENVRLPDSLLWLYYPLVPLLRARRFFQKSDQAAFERNYFSGATLYGDDFDEARIRMWWQREQRAYFSMAPADGTYVYGHHAANEFHCYRYLTGHYPLCLAFGCARGDDVAPLAGQVGRFVAIEPARAWWAESIHGTPAQYYSPAVTGEIPLDSASADLVVCFSALHHVPNAGRVFSEMARVLRPGGLILVREPVCTLGDWRKQRRGLTPDERGFPPGWFEERAAALGLRTLRKAYCDFPLTTRLAQWFHLGPAFDNAVLVRLDAWMSRLMRWNLHYHRDTFFKKIAPIEVVYTFLKDGGVCGSDSRQLSGRASDIADFAVSRD